MVLQGLGHLIAVVLLGLAEMDNRERRDQARDSDHDHAREQRFPTEPSRPHEGSLS